MNFMYENRVKEELLNIENVNTRARAAPLFKTALASCEKYKNTALYHGIFYGTHYLQILET